MARKRKTDHEAAVSGALGLFWRKGYGGASTREIEAETGLTRFTLQTAYGGKESFFLETLDAYLDNAEALHFPDGELDTLDGLAEWFRQRASVEMMPRIEDAGCLAFNSISEFDRTNNEINARIARYMTSLEGRFLKIIDRAVAGGEVDIVPKAAAKNLLSLLLGLHVVMKARADDADAAAYGMAASDLILSWKSGTQDA